MRRGGVGDRTLSGIMNITTTTMQRHCSTPPKDLNNENMKYNHVKKYTHLINTKFTIAME